MTTRLTRSVLLAACVLLATTGCGTHSISTAPDQVGLHYLGGAFSNKSYDSYVPASTKKWFGPGDQEYLYPNNQRSYDATGGPGSESKPIISVSRDQAEMSVPVSVTFRLRTDQKSLRAFHENIGNRYRAYMHDDETTAGWREMLAFYIGQPLNVSLDREVQGANWRDLYSKPGARTTLQTKLDSELPDLVRQKLQGDYFDDFQVLVQQPTPTNAELKQAIAQQQAAVAAAQSAQAQAEAQRLAARAQVAVQQQQALKTKADISAYGSVDEYNKAQAILKGINPYQPTYVVGGGLPQPAPSPGG
jgi:SPFH domain / Band 7 family